MPLLGNYNPNEPRDKEGKWTTGGSSASSSNLLGANKAGNSIASAQKVMAKHEVSPEHQKAITSYTSGDYNPINGYLRGKKNTITDEHAATVEKLSNFLENAPKVQATTYRGIKLSEYDKDEFIGKLKSGDLFNDKGFMSSSHDKNVAAKFGTSDRVKAIVTIEGKNGVLIEHLSDAKHEKEVLFNRNTKLIIKDFKIKTDKKGIFTDISVTLSEP